jgi:hypothetical protein
MIHQASLRVMIGALSLFLTGEVTTSVFHSSAPDPIVQEVDTAFHVYNPAVSDDVVDKFVEVIYRFKLHEHARLCIYHVCLESSVDPDAQSPTGAIGLCQITPTTAFDVLHKMPEEDRKLLYDLDVDDFDWAIKGRYSTNDDGPFIANALRKKAIKWLKVPDNNMALWGYIMSGYLSEMGPHEAFLSYRMGLGGARRYKGNVDSHPYIRGLYKVEATIKKKSATGRSSS